MYICYIILIGCNISDIGCKSLSDNLSSIAQLKILNLNDNNITFKGITDLANSFKSITHLKKLYINDNLIGSEGMKSLGNNMRYIPEVIILEISNNNIDDEGMKIFTPDLTWTVKIEVLNFSSIYIYILIIFIYIIDNKITCVGIKELGKLLYVIPHLRELYLNYNLLQNDGINILCEYITISSDLQILEIQSIY